MNPSSKVSIDLSNKRSWVWFLTIVYEEDFGCVDGEHGNKKNEMGSTIPFQIKTKVGIIFLQRAVLFRTTQ